MVMRYIKKRAERTEKSQELDPPSWASAKNASLNAWLYVEQAKKTKALYIRRHHKITDFSKQQTYQIKGSEVAKALEMNRSTLMNTSTYSKDFSDYLDNVNQELEKAKNAKIQSVRKSPSRGTIRNSKDELLMVNKKLQKEVDELENQKTEELVRCAFDQIPLPVKKKLGID